MSLKDSFSEDEWFLLSSTPAFIGASMSAAEKSGVIGTVKELSASMRSTVSGLKDYPDSELIQELLKKAENWDEAKEKMSDYKERSQEKMQAANIQSSEALQDQMLRDVEACVALVDEKCTSEDARIYKEWSLKIANNVALASKEGGFMGFGGTAVGENEKALIAKVEAALGINAGALFA